jgi:hypothetical protein
LAGLLVEKALPRAWEAVCDRPLSGHDAVHGPCRLTAVDRWRLPGTAAWGTLRARPSRKFPGSDHG